REPMKRACVLFAKCGTARGANREGSLRRRADGLLLWHGRREAESHRVHGERVLLVGRLERDADGLDDIALRGLLQHVLLHGGADALQQIERHEALRREKLLLKTNPDALPLATDVEVRLRKHGRRVALAKRREELAANLGKFLGAKGAVKRKGHGV